MTLASFAVALSSVVVVTKPVKRLLTAPLFEKFSVIIYFNKLFNQITALSKNFAACKNRAGI